MPVLSSSSKNCVAILAIVLITFLAFFPTLSSEFVNWDDDVHLLENPFVHSLDRKHLKDIFTTTVNKIYIPLTSLSFAIEYHFFGANPFVYHFNNLLLHLLVTVLVYYFAKQCGLSLIAALMAAFIFGIHPMHVESVAWVTERKDVLYSFFYMLALVSYAQYVHILKAGYAKLYIDPISILPDENLKLEKTGKRYFIAAVFLGFLSVLAKPMALSLPGALLVYDWLMKRKFSFHSILEKVIVAFFIAPVAWITYLLQMRAVNVDFSQAILSMVWSFIFYIRKFFYPDYFTLIYELPKPIVLSNPQYLFAVVLGGLLLVSIIVFRRSRFYIFAFLLYIASIFFLLRWDIRGDTNIVADRFMYLPSIGMCMLVGIFYDKIFERFKKVPYQKITIVFIGLLLGGGLFVQTWRQCQVWTNSSSLWQHQLKKQGHVATALVYNNLAHARLNERDFQEIVQQYRLNPARTDYQEEINQVLQWIFIAIRIKPDYDNAFYNLAKVQYALGNNDWALESFMKVVQLNPMHFEAFYDIGNLYIKLGNHKQAVNALKQAIAINPDNESMYLRVLDSYETAIEQGAVDYYSNEKERLMKTYQKRF